MALADNACVPCRGGVPPLEPPQVAALLAELKRDYTSVKHIKPPASRAGASWGAWSPPSS